MTPQRARILLGVGLGASAAEVEAAFRQRAWACHPDRGGDPRRFAEVAVARDVLLRARPAAPVVVVPDANLRRRALAGTVRRWMGRTRPGPPRVT